MTSEREAGFYWVRLWDDRWAGEWQVAQYTFHRLRSGAWWLIATECETDDSDMAQVGERLTPPDYGFPLENPNWKPDFTNRSPLEMQRRGEIG